ncbi:hypothetical protein [Plantactinospora endophytica]|uniref:Uncharacterized protein n=1 Tax=Plantactinospora endophytica TaxID=673535 RepID=A0ABQ4EBE3_9ACTN|nr:hypothetical protein [Plantactinospora endophytica]GIG92024.1 hypothetical protein Pen02_69600 [Plantactinospora endophytica]
MRLDEYPDPPPPTRLKQQNERLQAELASCQQALRLLEARLTEAKVRLGMISRIVQDADRTRRAPAVSFAAVRAALYVQPDRLRDLGADLPIL